MTTAARQLAGLLLAYTRWVDQSEEIPAPLGCSRCAADDAASAWQAMTSNRVASLAQESHFSVQVTGCTCGQRFGVVFTERIDWRGGEDDQTWLALPISAPELARLMTAAEADLAGILTELGRHRRFLVRCFPTGGSLDSWWREGGFAIGPHD